MRDGKLEPKIKGWGSWNGAAIPAFTTALGKDLMPPGLGQSVAVAWKPNRTFIFKCDKRISVEGVRQLSPQHPLAPCHSQEDDTALALMLFVEKF
jgi:hypothetical protein